MDGEKVHDFHASKEVILVETNQQSEQQLRSVPEPSEKTNLAAALITTAVWASVGALAGRIIGSMGDRLPTTGPGKTVGTLIGAVTGGAIAFGTSLKIIGQNKAKNKDLEFSAQAHAVGGFIPTNLPRNANAMLPSTMIANPELEGMLAQQPLDKAR